MCVAGWASPIPLFQKHLLKRFRMIVCKIDCMKCLGGRMYE
jgi:hypothetical protein